MENNLIDEEPTIKIINNSKALQYKVKYNGKNIMKIPAYKQWLDLMKTEKGDNGIICYCIKCHLFYYFENYEQKNNDFECKYDLAEFCEYCGELYIDDSLCCYRIVMKTLERELYRTFELDCFDYFYFIPYISLIYYFTRFFFVIFSMRKKGDDINYQNAIMNDNNVVFVIFVLLTLLYSLIFLLSFTIFYFFHLYFVIKVRKQRIKDKYENITRY